MRFAIVTAVLVAACSDPASSVLHPTDAAIDAPADVAMDAAIDVAPSPPVVLANAQLSVTLRTDTFGMTVANAAGNVLLTTVSPGATVANDPQHAYTALGATHDEWVIRPAIIEGWDHTIAVPDAWHHGQNVVRYSATDTSAAFDLEDASDPSVVLHAVITIDGAEIRIDAMALGAAGDAGVPASRPLNAFGQGFVLGGDEHFFGLGERNVTVDQRGTHFECWVEEGGLGLGESAAPSPTNPFPNGPAMTGIPIPFMISTRGYGVWIDSTYRTGFSLGADDPTAWRLYSTESALHYRIFVHADPRDTIAHYTSITGRANLPAPWVFGPRRRVDHGSTVDGMPEELALRAFHVPTTMVDDTTHFLPIASEDGREAFLQSWTSQMNAVGFKAIGYFNPHVSLSDPAAADLVNYGRDNNLFVRSNDGTEFDTNVVSAGVQVVATIDLTNPAAVAWYQTLLQGALDLGYDGWMLDFGEYLPPTALMFDGTTGWQMHNAFPLLVQQTVFDYLTQVRGTDFQFFVRSGYTGTQSVTPMVWSGDPSASYDNSRGIPAVIREAVNAGMSGIPFWGSDVSGYTCLHDPPPDKEVYLRWAELGALSPDMHDENACAQAPAGSPPKWTLWSDSETTSVYASYAQLHTRLIPYIYAAALEATQTGMPIMRHPFLLNPTDPNALSVQFEYYFGPALYVAPIVHRGDVSRTFWLPPGQWFDFWTGEPVAGGVTVTRDAPLDTLPLLLRSGQMVAMLDPSVETLAPHTDPTVVGIADVAGLYDVRAGLDAANASARSQLVDGTVFELTLGTAPPALPTGFAVVTDDAALASCTLGCARMQPAAGGTTELQITTPSAMDQVVTAGGVTLHHHASTPTRVRWDLLLH